MGLLLTPYDPTAAANVLIHAAEVGQQRRDEQARQLAKVAKDIADERQREIERNRLRDFEQRKFDEGTRRWNVENSPIDAAPRLGTPGGEPALPQLDSGSVPADSAPAAAANLGAIGLPAGPATENPWKPGGMDLSTAGPFAPLDLPVGSDATAQGPSTDMGPGQAVNPNVADALSLPNLGGGVDPLNAAAVQIDNTTMPGQGKMHGQLVPRPASAPMAGVLPVAGDGAAGNNPLLPNLDEQHQLLQNRLHQAGVPRKTALAQLAEFDRQAALQQMRPPAGKDSMVTAPDGTVIVKGIRFKKNDDGTFTEMPKQSAGDLRVHGTFTDPDTGAVHTQFANGTWDTPPPDAGRLKKLGANEVLPKVKSTFVDSETGAMHTQFNDGKWDTTPPDPSKLRKIAAPIAKTTTKTFVDAKTGELFFQAEDGKFTDAQGDASFPDNPQNLQKLGSQSAAKQSLAETKDARAAAEKPAEAKAKAIATEQANLRGLMSQRRLVKPGTGSDGKEAPMTPSQLDNAKAFDAQITASQERLKALGGEPLPDEPPAVAPAAAAAAPAKTVWRADAKTGMKWEYDAETKKPTGRYIGAPATAGP